MLTYYKLLCGTLYTREKQQIEQLLPGYQNTLAKIQELSTINPINKQNIITTTTY